MYYFSNLNHVDMLMGIHLKFNKSRTYHLTSIVCCLLFCSNHVKLLTYNVLVLYSTSIEY